MYKVILLLFFFSSSLQAQPDLSSFSSTGRGVAVTFNTDYQSIGINPSMLGINPGDEDTKITFGFFEQVISAHARNITIDDIEEYIRLEESDTLSIQKRIEGVEIFFGKPININNDLMWFGFCMNTGKKSRLAFNIKETIRSYNDFTSAYTQFAFFSSAAYDFFPKLILNNNDTVNTPSNPYDLAQYFEAPYNGIKAGYNPNGLTVGQLVNGSHFKLNWYREINLAYGREIINRDDEFNMAFGIGAKYLIGVAYTDIQVENNKLTGVASYNPYLNGEIHLDSILGIPNAEQDGSLLSPVGHGLGFDVGVTAKFRNTYKVALSVLNIGKITYDRNLYEIHDSTFTTIKFQDEIFKGFDDIVKWNQVTKVSVDLPTYLRFGGSVLLAKGKFEIGADMIWPLNNRPGNFNKPVYALGGDFYVIKRIKLSTGINLGGNYATSAGLDNYSTHVNIPLGISFQIGKNTVWEFGFATRDIQAVFDLNKINYSFAEGMLRFKI